MKDQPTNCPNFDIDDAIKLFGAYLHDCVDDGMRSSPIDNYLAAMYQAFALVRLSQQRSIMFVTGRGNKTPNAYAYHQLAKAGFANVDIVKADGKAQETTFTPTDEGLAVVRWMIEGKQADE